MIVLRSVTKHIGRWRYGKRVLDDVNAVFPAKTNWVIFGGAESGKTTLLNILCGAVAPTRGSVETHGLVGLPVGSNVPLGFYDTAQTVATRTARLFHANVEDVLKFTDDFTGLGSRIKRPLNELSAAQRAEFNFALGYALPLDFYLFDMTYGPTGEPMRSSCLAAFKQRKSEAGTIYVTRHLRGAKEFGDRGGVLIDGKLYLFDTVEEAAAEFERSELALKTGTLAYGEALYSRGEYEQAAGYLLEYIAEGEPEERAFHLLGESAFRIGRYEEAARACEVALELFPDSVEANFVLAKIAERNQRLDEATVYVRNVLNVEPQHREALSLLARTLEGTGLAKEAADIRRGLAAADGQIGSLKAAMRADIRAQNWSNVLASATELAGRAGDDVSLMHARARAFIEVGQIGDALPLLTELGRLDIQKALQLVDVVRRKNDADGVASILRAIPVEQLRANLSSPLLRGGVTFLEREILSAKRSGAQERAQSLAELLDAINPSRSRPASVAVTKDAAETPA